MRVTHLIKATGLSGAEAHLVTLLPALAQLECDCRLVVLAEPGRVPRDFLAAAATAGLAPEVIKIYHDADPSLAYRLAGRLRQTRPDILHTHLIHADLHGAAAAALAGVPVLVTSRHNDDPFRRQAAVKAANRLALRRARKVIAISQALADFVVRVEGAPAHKVTFIHYGLEAQTYLSAACAGRFRAEMRWGDSAPVVLFAGRLTAQKGIDTLLAAWRPVSAQCPAARLVIAGDGDLRGLVERFAATEPVPATVSLLGWRSDMPTLMADADALVVPSLWEGFGLVTLEAMAAGKPVIASRVSALPEIVVDSETGRLVPPGEPQALAEAILQLIGDRDLARQMGLKGRERLDVHFSVHKMAERHREVYLALRPS